MLQSAELTAAAIVRIGNHWNLLFLCSSPGTHFSLGLPLRNFHPFCRFGEQDRPGSCKFGFLNCFKWRTNPWYEKPAGQLSSPPPPEEPKNCSNGGSRWCVGNFLSDSGRVCTYFLVRVGIGGQRIRFFGHTFASILINLA